MIIILNKNEKLQYIELVMFFQCMKIHSYQIFITLIGRRDLRKNW